MNRVLVIVMVACAQGARGQSTIAYFNGLSFSVPAMYGSAKKDVDFDGDGAPEVVFWSNGRICTHDAPTSACSWPFHVGATGTNALLVSGFALVQLVGTQIGGNPPVGAVWSTTQPYGATLTANWWHFYGEIVDGHYTESDSGWNGTLGTLTNGYLAVRFQAGDGLHYGWIRVRLPGPIEIVPVVVEWAYETRPHTAIIAGAKPVTVPMAAPEVVRPGQLRLKWQSEIGRAYQIQAKESLTAPLWTNLEFVVVGTTTNAAVDIPITGTSRFFRAVETD